MSEANIAELVERINGLVDRAVEKKVAEKFKEFFLPRTALDEIKAEVNNVVIAPLIEETKAQVKRADDAKTEHNDWESRMRVLQEKYTERDQEVIALTAEIPALKKARDEQREAMAREKQEHLDRINQAFGRVA